MYRFKKLNSGLCLLQRKHAFLPHPGAVHAPLHVLLCLAHICKQCCTHAQRQPQCAFQHCLPCHQCHKTCIQCQVFQCVHAIIMHDVWIMCNCFVRYCMSATTICNAMHHQLFEVIAPTFAHVGVSLTADHIHCDLARFTNSGFESTFSLSNVENVDRKQFHAAAQMHMQHDDKMQIFKVKSKRPDKNVRFYIKYGDKPQVEPCSAE